MGKYLSYRYRAFYRRIIIALMANGEAQAIKIINEELKQSPDYLKW